jgi:uncharacterized protein YbaR (Trm112 family)
MICEKCGDIEKFGVYYDTHELPKTYCTRCGTKFKIVKTVNGKPLMMNKEARDLIDGEPKSPE